MSATNTKTEQDQLNKQQDPQKRQEGQDQRKHEQGSHNPGQNPNIPQRPDQQRSDQKPNKS